MRYYEKQQVTTTFVYSSPTGAAPAMPAARTRRCCSGSPPAAASGRWLARPAAFAQLLDDYTSVLCHVGVQATARMWSEAERRAILAFSLYKHPPVQYRN